MTIAAALPPLASPSPVPFEKPSLDSVNRVKLSVPRMLMEAR